MLRGAHALPTGSSPTPAMPHEHAGGMRRGGARADQVPVAKLSNGGMAPPLAPHARRLVFDAADTDPLAKIHRPVPAATAASSNRNSGGGALPPIQSRFKTAVTDQGPRIVTTATPLGSSPPASGAVAPPLPAPLPVPDGFQPFPVVPPTTEGDGGSGGGDSTTPLASTGSTLETALDDTLSEPVVKPSAVFSLVIGPPDDDDADTHPPFATSIDVSIDCASATSISGSVDDAGTAPSSQQAGVATLVPVPPSAPPPRSPTVPRPSGKPRFRRFRRADLAYNVTPPPDGHDAPTATDGSGGAGKGTAAPHRLRFRHRSRHRRRKATSAATAAATCTPGTAPVDAPPLEGNSRTPTAPTDFTDVAAVAVGVGTGEAAPADAVVAVTPDDSLLELLPTPTKNESVLAVTPMSHRPTVPTISPPQPHPGALLAELLAAQRSPDGTAPLTPLVGDGGGMDEPFTTPRRTPTSANSLPENNRYAHPEARTRHPLLELGTNAAAGDGAPISFTKGRPVAELTPHRRFGVLSPVGKVVPAAMHTPPPPKPTTTAATTTTTTGAATATTAAATPASQVRPADSSMMSMLSSSATGSPMFPDTPLSMAGGLTPRPFTDEEMRVMKLFQHVRSDDVDRVRQALQRADITTSTRDEYGNTILMLAAENGSKKMAKLAVKFGADVNHTNLAGNTALHLACFHGHTRLSKWLIARGASDKVLNDAGFTCYEGAHDAHA